MDGGAWWAAIHGVANSWTRLSDFTSTFHLHALERGNGNPLQCSCLENPRDWGAWWAAIYGVAQSRTRLKQLSSSQHWWASCYYRKFPQGSSTSSCPTLVPPATRALGKVQLLCFRVNVRRQWHHTPVLVPGKSHGWRSLVGCSPWGR